MLSINGYYLLDEHHTSISSWHGRPLLPGSQRRFHGRFVPGPGRAVLPERERQVERFSLLACLR